MEVALFIYTNIKQRKSGKLSLTQANKPLDSVRVRSQTKVMVT